MRLSGVTLALVFAGSVVTFTQSAVPGQPTPGQPPQPEQRTPARDVPTRGNDPAVGTAVLRGQVSSEDGTPLRRANVRAFAQDGRPGGGVASTDARGRFEIKDLPAGRYSVNASKAGYVTMQFGQRRPEQAGSGRVLDVLDGQVVERVQIALPRGGVITGRVLDDFGEPIAGAQIQAQRYRFMSGGRRLTTASSDSTDDQGSFRIYGLAPGEYVVSGLVRPQTMSLPGQSVNLQEGFAPSYYPGTASPAEAQRVTVKGGQEISGVNFALSASRLARVRGRVVTAAGESPGAPMMVMFMGGEIDMFMMSNNATTRADGNFQLAGVAPGSYTVMARPMGKVGPRPEFAQLRLTITNEDVDNVVLVLSRGAIARGVVTTDEGTPLPVSPQTVRLFASSADPAPDPSSGGMPTVADDWTVEMPGLFGRRLLRASLSEPGDWFLKAIYFRDQDVTDTALEFSPGQVLDGFNFVFTRKVNEVNGAVTNDKSQPVLDAMILIFANDSTRWSFGTRYIRTARVDQSGRFRLRNLAPYDEYRLIAVRDVEDGRWFDPEFLNQVRDSAARVSLSEGQTVVQDLKVQRAQ